jgi:hypothetical protein
MRASVCALPSPVRHQPSLMMRASVSALPSPVRRDPASPRLRASISSLPPPARLDVSPPRAKLDLPAAAAAGKENIPAASPLARSARKEHLDHYADDSEERVALDLAALARVASPVAGPLFVRGRLYDLYSARRDERLKRKHGFPYGGEWVSPEAMAEDPCVAVELSKRRVAKKPSVGAESVRRSMPANEFVAGRTRALGTRSSLRSSKEMKKASAASGAMSMAVKERRVNPRSSSSSRRI